MLHDAKVGYDSIRYGIPGQKNDITVNQPPNLRRYGISFPSSFVDLLCIPPSCAHALQFARRAFLFISRSFSGAVSAIFTYAGGDSLGRRSVVTSFLVFSYCTLTITALQGTCGIKFLCLSYPVSGKIAICTCI